MATLNLGILAHVDAGKTTLTERILFESGVIAAPGRVDRGTTQTDTLALERQRGITIQSAVAAFRIDDLTVNLIDTPGHPDFIAEVDRALLVLDAVIVVVSAVAGVQPQTQRLVQAVRATGLPFVIFVNKIDCPNARGLELLPELARDLGLSPVAMTAVSGVGSREATVSARALEDPAFANTLLDALAAVDDTIIARFLHDGSVPPAALQAALRRNVATGRIVPVVFGSAMTGAGVAELLAGLARLLPRGQPCPEAPLSAVVFTVQRSPAGEKVALARVFAGTLAVRDQVAVRRALPGGSREERGGQVTGLERFVGGKPGVVGEVTGGDIARVHGLREVRVGDVLGALPAHRAARRFTMPTLESIVRPEHAADAGRTYAALRRLEEHDPLINVRRGRREPTIAVRLYGEVQKEVIQATLSDEFGLRVAFAESQVLCIERVTGSGSAREAIAAAGNPFPATVAFRIDPGDEGSGITYRGGLGAVPTAFYRAIEETVSETLEEGLCGWPVRDVVVTLTDVGMVSPITVAGDYRKLTPLVLMSALRAAGTEVCEPVERFTLEAPAEVVGELYAHLAGAGAITEEADHRSRHCHMSGTIPTASVNRFERLLPELTSGAGTFRSEPAGYRPCRGVLPSRPRTDFDPLHRARYLAAVSRL